MERCRECVLIHGEMDMAKCRVCHSKNNDILVVDICLKDDSIIKDCAIFNDGTRGERAIQNEEGIKSRLKKLPWYCMNEGWVRFQSFYVNGIVHIDNIKSYEIHWTENNKK